MKLSFLFELHLVPITFSLILGDFFMVSPPIKYGEGGLFSQKKIFMGGQILGETFMGGLFYMGELIIRLFKGGRGGWRGGVSLEQKTLTIL